MEELANPKLPKATHVIKMLSWAKDASHSGGPVKLPWGHWEGTRWRSLELNYIDLGLRSSKLKIFLLSSKSERFRACL